MEELLDGEAEEITRVVIEKAKGGDMAAIRICLDRSFLRLSRVCPVPIQALA